MSHEPDTLEGVAAFCEREGQPCESIRRLEAENFRLRGLLAQRHGVSEAARGYAELAYAARVNDELSETLELGDVLDRIGLELEGVLQVAEQRAARAVLAVTDKQRLVEMAEAVRARRRMVLELDAKQKELMVMANLATIDGIALGVRASTSSGR